MHTAKHRPRHRGPHRAASIQLGLGDGAEQPAHAFHAFVAYDDEGGTDPVGLGDEPGGGLAGRARDRACDVGPGGGPVANLIDCPAEGRGPSSVEAQSAVVRGAE